MSTTTKTTQQQALQILIEGVVLAQSRGAYKLKEASQLSEAIDFFTVPAAEVEVDKSVDESK